jgi:hypothetical protein
LSPSFGGFVAKFVIASAMKAYSYRFLDPARFSLGHGGKPSLSGADQGLRRVIRVLKSAVQKAKLGRDEETQALKRLDDRAWQLEHMASGPSLEAFVATEQNVSPLLGGRSVFGWEEEIAKTGKGRSG